MASRPLRLLTMAGMLCLQLSGVEAEASVQGEASEAEEGYILEAYPSRVLRSLTREEQRRSVASKRVGAPFALIVPVSRRWRAGQLVRIAFAGGTADLHARIETAARTWVAGDSGANLQLSFRNPDGTFRTWNSADTDYQAEIRIAFESDGYWSLVGRDSLNRNLDGGSPGQASMNLQGFAEELPDDWRTTVLHEFGHALGFEHEHQSPLAQCGFKFYNDSGYELTTNSRGVYTRDGQHRWPGLYTYLSGEPNNWDSNRVDANLQAIEDTTDFFSSGQFDNRSIMRYWFPEFFFSARRSSPCWSDRENSELSEVDLASVRAVYPRNPSIEMVAGREVIQQLFYSAREGSTESETIRRALKIEPRP